MVDKRLIAQKVGANLKRIREGKNLSMQDLATLAEVEKSQIYRIENGRVDVRVSTLVNLATVLNIHLNQILEL